MERIDKMTFIDGTAKWELRKIIDAKTLDGNSLENIIEQSLQRVVKVKIESGTISSGAAIPVPSGFERQHCRYAITALGINIYTYDTQYKRCDWSINQDTGVVQARVRGDEVSGSLSGYLCVAVK